MQLTQQVSPAGFRGLWPSGPRGGQLGPQATAFVPPCLMSHKIVSKSRGFESMVVVYAGACVGCCCCGPHLWAVCSGHCLAALGCRGDGVLAFAEVMTAALDRVCLACPQPRRPQPSHTCLDSRGGASLQYAVSIAVIGLVLSASPFLPSCLPRLPARPCCRALQCLSVQGAAGC